MPIYSSASSCSARRVLASRGHILSAGLAMLLSAFLAVIAKPTNRINESRARIDLEKLVPQRFANWQVDDNAGQVPVSPDVQAKLDIYYGQVLSRLYVNSRYEHVQLTVAYGADQSNENMHVHRPEFCYRSQGFDITNAGDDVVTLGETQLPVRRLLAMREGRTEPVTYWMTVGDIITRPGLSRKLAELSYGLSGTIPDGMLVRLSSPYTAVDVAYPIQDDFLRKLLEAVAPEERVRLAGNAQIAD